MNRILNRANQRISLGGAAALLLAVSLVGQVLGFLRTTLVNANFSAYGPQSTDAYFAAFKIPDFFFFTLAAGALGVAFMPVLSEYLGRGDRKGAWDISSSLLNLLAIIMAIVGVVIFVFAEPLIRSLWHLGPEQLNNAVFIMRCIAFNPLLFTISGILVSMQQTIGRFFFYAIAPLFYNMCIILSIFVFRNNIGLIGLGIGAAIGAVLQLLIVLLGMYKIGFRYRFNVNWSNKGFRVALRQIPPRSIDQGIDSINSIVETNLSTRLGPGNLTFYENAYILHSVPIQLVGTTIATASFPRLNDRLASGRKDLFRKDFMKILRAMIWIILPIAVVAYFSRGYLARIIYKSSADEIALIFGYLVVAIIFRTIYALLSRWFYAQKDTRTPLFVSLFTIALNIILAYTLSRPTAYGVVGLAMAQSIVAAVEVAILFAIMLIRDRKLFDRIFWGGLLKIASVTGFTILAAFIMLTFLPLGAYDRGFVTLGSKLGAIAAVTFSVHFFVSLIFGLEETKPIVSRLRKIALTPIKGPLS